MGVEPEEALSKIDVEELGEKPCEQDPELTKSQMSSKAKAE